jgi:hypothetical protein
MADQTWSMGAGMTELQDIFGMLFEGKGIEPLPFAWKRAARGQMRPFLTLPFNGEASDYYSSPPSSPPPRLA